MLEPSCMHCSGPSGVTTAAETLSWSPEELGWLQITVAEYFGCWFSPGLEKQVDAQVSCSVLGKLLISAVLAAACKEPLKPLGVNHLMPPTFLILPSVCFAEEDVENFDVTNLSQDVLRSIEADSFWCMSKLLDGIQVSCRDVSPCLMQQRHCLLSVSGGELCNLRH